MASSSSSPHMPCISTPFSPATHLFTAVKLSPPPLYIHLPKTKHDLRSTITEMCRYHAVPVKVPPLMADLHLSQYTRKNSIHIHNRNHAAQTMDPPPATATATAAANPPNNGTSAYSFSDFTFLQEELDDDGQEKGKEWVDNCESDTETSTSQHPLLFPHDQLCRILQGVCSCTTQLDAKLLRDVTDALRISSLSVENESVHRNNSANLRGIVMNGLQWRGYNAGICKSRWEETNGYPAGEYEFIDVIVGEKSSSDRVLVDIDFRAQFEIARPTPEYAALAGLLPVLLVGSVEKVREIIRIMCDAARRSLKARGLHLPPWRKKRYVEAKWLGSQKRSTQMAPLQSVEWNACFLQQNNIRSAKLGQISGLGRALAQPLTSKNVY